MIRHDVSREISTTVVESASAHEDFFRYTSGRWLWDEESRLSERYLRFNVCELKRIAAESVKAQSCKSMTKLTEGRSNRVFRLVMDNGSVAIALIPMLNGGRLAQKPTASEVATMDFARTVLNIPAPKVFAWSMDSGNSVGTEYVIMEEAPGTQLQDVWETQDISQKEEIVQALVNIEKKLLSVSFTQYGNIYFASDAFPGCEAAEVIGDLPPELKVAIEERFVIGPVVARGFYKGERASMAIERGPWKSPYDYLKAIANREIAWLSSFASLRPSHNPFSASEAPKSPSSHISLYEKFLRVIPYLLPQKTELSRSSLWHWDMHFSNVFVEGSQFRYPKIVDYDGEIILKLPETYESLEGEEKASMRRQVERSLVMYLYVTCTDETNPLLSEVLRVGYSKRRQETVKFSENTWDGDFLFLRQCLIRLERDWAELGFDVPCPIHFTEEELQANYAEGEGWNERADFWDSMRGIVDRDGWTTNEMYDEALEMFIELREVGLNELTGEERAEFDKQMIWAQRGPKERLPPQSEST
ncbi:hypothetical protein LZ554_004042 [Drepanopeziza brunnea f. sp. 'monogermtubi']|nr:hypothetical protein LZ554_004042 [Drepanopeziza brunnea f. sp. 'monogermtubi']